MTTIRLAPGEMQQIADGIQEIEQALVGMFKVERADVLLTYEANDTSGDTPDTHVRGTWALGSRFNTTLSQGEMPPDPLRAALAAQVAKWSAAAEEIEARVPEDGPGDMDSVEDDTMASIYSEAAGAIQALLDA